MTRLKPCAEDRRGRRKENKAERNEEKRGGEEIKRRKQIKAKENSFKTEVLFFDTLNGKREKGSRKGGRKIEQSILEKKK